MRLFLSADGGKLCASGAQKVWSRSMHEMPSRYLPSLPSLPESLGVTS